MATLGRGNIRAGTAAVGVLVVLSPLGLAACGDDEDAASSDGSVELSGDYCTDLDAMKSWMTGVGPPSGGQFAAGMESARAVAAEAPEEVEGDWQRFVQAIDEFEAVLDDAGLSLEEARDAEDLDLSDPDERQLWTDLMKPFVNREMGVAGNNIRAHAEQVCGIEYDAGKPTNDVAGATPEAEKTDPFCADLADVDLLTIAPTAKEAAALARATDGLVADAPAKLRDELRAVADSFRELARIEAEGERMTAYSESAILDLLEPVVSWRTDNCFPDDGLG